MYKTPTQKKIFIMNIIITLVCIISIAGYFMFPILNLNVSLHLNAQNIHDMTAPDDAHPDSMEFDVETIEELLGKDGVFVELHLKLTSSDLLEAMQVQDGHLTKNIIENTVREFSINLSDVFHALAINMSKLATKMLVTETVKSYAQEALGDDATEEEVNNKLHDLGFTDDFINQETEKIIEVMYQEDATPANVADTVEEIVVDVIQMFKDSGDEDFKDLEFTDDVKQEIHNGVEEVLKNFVNEEGYIDMDSFVHDILGALLNGEELPDFNIPTNYAVEQKEPTEEEIHGNEEIILEIVHDKLVSQIPEETYILIDEIMSYIGILILFSIAMWAYVILKIIVKLGMRNNSVKLKAPIWFGSIPFTLFYLIPNLYIYLINHMDLLFGLIGGAEDSSSSAVTTAMNAVKIKATSCSLIPFICGTFLVFFSLFFYGRTRRKLKREIRAERKELKLQQRADNK